MAQQSINLGTPNNEDGDFVRDAFSKAQSNFTELYGKTNTSDFINDGENGTSTFVETDELGATAFSNSYGDLDDLPTIPNAPTGLEAIDEGNGIGWRLIGRNPAQFGNIGSGAIDFGTYFGVATAGALGEVSVNFGWDNTNSGEASFTNGYLNQITSTAKYTFSNGQSNYTSGFGGFTHGVNMFNRGGSNDTNYNTSFGRVNDTSIVGGIQAGLSLRGQSVGTAIFGQANVEYTGTNNVANTATDPIFIVGNGDINNSTFVATSRSDAIRGLKNGTWYFPSYGDGSITGTATYGAAFDADGKLIEVPLGGGSGGAVDSVNGQTGDVVLDADDISDTSTTNKFVTATEKGLISAALQPSAISNEAYNATTWDSATPGDAAETTAPSKNAIRDKIETLATLDTLQSFTAPKRFTNSLIITADGTNTNDYIRFEGNNNSAPTGNPTIGVSQDKLYFTFDNFTPSSPTVGYRASFTGNKDFTTNRTFTFPNKSGTIALLDDIVGGGSGDYSEWATYSGTRAGSNLSLTLGDYDNSGNGSKISINDATGLITLTGAGGNYFSISGGGDANLSTNLYMSLGNSYAWTQGGYSMRLRRPTTLTQNSELLIPEGNQTIPISVNGNYANSAGDITISTGGSTTINNTLTSTSTTEALSANMGKTLKDVQDLKAPLASPTFTGTPILPSTFTIGANSFIRNGAHDLTITTSGTSNVTFPSGNSTVLTSGAQQFITARKTFNSSTIFYANPANTRYYKFLGSAITDDRTVLFPLLTADDEFTFNNASQTLTNKTLALGSNTLSGTKAQFDTAVTDGNFLYVGDIPTINTTFQSETYASSFAYIFDAENPNKYVDLTGNITITTSGTVNGDSGMLYLNRASGTETIAFGNGTAPTNTNYPTGASDTVELYFIHTDSGLKWYLNNPTKVAIDTTATINMIGDRIYDDTTVDTATLTLNNCQIGATLKMYINRASMPTLAGTNVLYNQLPNTTPFITNTDMVVTFIVTPLVSGSDKIVDYYITQRT